MTIRRKEPGRIAGAARSHATAALMLISSALIATGGALEFRYFGPGTPQFTAGLIATPAGLLGCVGAVALWRRGHRTFVSVCALALLAGTVIATGLDVMGPPATLLGVAGGIAPLLPMWATGKRS
jgi:preprotein translocase subunit SecD